MEEQAKKPRASTRRRKTIYGEDRHVVTLRVSPAMHAQMTARASDERVSVNTLMRRALEAELAKPVTPRLSRAKVEG